VLQSPHRLVQSVNVASIVRSIQEKGRKREEEERREKERNENRERREKEEEKEKESISESLLI